MLVDDAGSAADTSATWAGATEPADPAGSSTGLAHWRLLTPRQWVWVRRVGLLVYLVVLLNYSRDPKHGLPINQREQTMVWIAAALAITCIGRSWRMIVRLLVDWVPFVAIFLLYDYSRGLADNVGIPTQVMPQILVDKLLFFGTVPTVWLQQHLYVAKPPYPWWYPVVTLTYVTHFFLPLVVAGFLWAKERRLYHQYVARLFFVSFLGVLTFCLFPAAPPWMASQGYGPDGVSAGHIGDVHRIANLGWGQLHLHVAKAWVEKGQATYNTVAAVPSLHAAYAFLIAVFFWKRIRFRWLRPLLLVHPLLMVFTIVYGGEHYVSDALMGWLYVALAFVVCGRIERWWRARSAPAFAPA